METENYTNQKKVLQLTTWSFLTGNMSNMPEDFFAKTFLHRGSLLQKGSFCTGVKEKNKIKII